MHKHATEEFPMRFEVQDMASVEMELEHCELMWIPFWSIVVSSLDKAVLFYGISVRMQCITQIFATISHGSELVFEFQLFRYVTDLHTSNHTK